MVDEARAAAALEAVDESLPASSPARSRRGSADSLSSSPLSEISELYQHPEVARAREICLSSPAPPSAELLAALETEETRVRQRELELSKRVDVPRRCHRPVPTRFWEPSPERRAACQSYPDLAEMFMSGSLPQEILFESVATYTLQPEDDWGMILSRYVKVQLDPSYRYRLLTPISIPHRCYVIGNGARVYVCPSLWSSSVKVSGGSWSRSAGIRNLYNTTFSDIEFVQYPKPNYRRELLRNPLFELRYPTLFHSCSFVGFWNRVVLKFEVTGEVRGCSFYHCNTCVDTKGCLAMKVSRCVFEDCQVCVRSEQSMTLTHNMALECGCFALLMNSGKVIGNQVIRQRAEAVLTCFGGEVMPLCALHITPSSQWGYPILKSNMFIECRIYVGERVGAIHFLWCNLNYTHILTDSVTVNRVVLCGSFRGLMWASRIVSRRAGASGGPVMCECGDSHIPLLPEVIPHLLAPTDPTVFPVNTVEYMSDAENEYFGGGL